MECEGAVIREGEKRGREGGRKEKREKLKRHISQVQCVDLVWNLILTNQM